MIGFQMLIVFFTISPTFINLFRGEKISVFINKEQYKPILIVLISIELFVLFMALISSYTLIYSIMILLLQLIILFFEIKFIKNGIYSKAIIIDGLFYDITKLSSFTINENRLEIRLEREIKSVMINKSDISRIVEFLNQQLIINL